MKLLQTSAKKQNEGCEDQDNYSLGLMMKHHTTNSGLKGWTFCQERKLLVHQLSINSPQRVWLNGW